MTTARFTPFIAALLLSSAGAFAQVPSDDYPLIENSI
jgi:hypothetical protein